MVKYTLYFFSLFISLSVFALDQVTASIDKNPVVQGESLILEIVANDSVDTNALNTSPLLKDFIVGRTSSSTQTRIINGQRSQQTKWTTVLIPKKPGQVIIPTFTIEKVNTAPITIEVLDKSNSELQKNRDVYITSDVSKIDVFVQEQFILTIKLYIALALESGTLSEPTMNNANIIQVGKDEQKEEIINGRRYKIIERKYAVTPLSSGEYSLEMPVFSGQVNVQTQRRSGVFGFPQTKPISVIADPINVSIKPQPASFQSTWLPTELLTLHEEWQPDLTEFKVGEPITRTITITAIGITKEQLPPINILSVPGLKIYPDQPQLHSGTNQQRLVSQVVINFAIVASNTGTFKLPEIRIPWWNTVTNREEFAILPAKNIIIQTNPDHNFNNSATGLSSNNQQIDESAFIDNNTNILDSKNQTVVIEKNSWLQWLFMILWLITSACLAISIWRNKYANLTTKPTNDKNINKKPYLQLIAACKENNAQQTLSLIVPWVKTLKSTHHISSINEALSILNDKEFKIHVENLQTSTYGKSPKTWSGTELLSSINRINKKKSFLNDHSDILLNP